MTADVLVEVAAPQIAIDEEYALAGRGEDVSEVHGEE